MTDRSSARPRLRLLLVPLAMLAAMLPVVTSTTPASAYESQNGADMVVINPGGGADPTGADGLQIVVNGTGGFRGVPNAEEQVPLDGSDQVFFADTSQWCCSGASVQINIGGQLYGEAGAAYSENAPSWDSTTVVSTSGSIGRAPADSEDLDDPTAQGSGSAHLRFEVTHNGLPYTVDRYITYTFPNNWYLDRYEVTIPAGSAEVVKLYAGGDAAPGNSDNGKGFGVGPGFGTAAALNTAYEVNPDSGIFISYGEIAGGGSLTGLYAAEYDEPVFPQIGAGEDIGFVVDLDEHDAGLDLQWTVGSTPGTFSLTQRTVVGFQSTAVTAFFAPFEVADGESSTLVFEVVNTEFDPASGGFEAPIPDGLSVVGSPTSDCGGAATASGGVVSLTGASIAAAAVCRVEVDVIGAAGSYALDLQDVVVSGGFTTGFGLATLDVVAGPGPGPGPTTTVPGPNPGPTPAPGPVVTPRFVG